MMKRQYTMTIKERIKRSLARKASYVFLRSEFTKLGSSSQVTRALASLVDDGELIRVSSGAYVKAEPSVLTGKPIPCVSMPIIVQELFDKLNVSIAPSHAAIEYATGKTTQIPGKLTISTGNRRISRRVQVGGQKLNYERATI